jgi:hypothetical protein
LLEESRGLGRALSGGDVICTVEAWCRYFWYCCYVSGMAPLLMEWFLSFGIVAVRPVILDYVAGMACSSL